MKRPPPIGLLATVALLMATPLDGEEIAPIALPPQPPSPPSPRPLIPPPSLDAAASTPVDRANPVQRCGCGHDHPYKSLHAGRREIAHCCPTCRCRRFQTPRGAA